MDPRACEHLREAAGVETINSAQPRRRDRDAAAEPRDSDVARDRASQRPWEVIERAAANLQDGGVLAVATPNPHAVQFRLLRRRWAHLDAPRHLYLIADDTLARRCAELGLRLHSTTTSDPAGRHWNRFGWEYALRRPPRSRPATRATAALSAAIAKALGPIERHGRNGCAYTSIFVKRAPT